MPASNMKFDISSVPISRIDSENDLFRITTMTNYEDLMRSISSVGLINPPLLLAADSKFIVVSGFRRIEASRKIGIDSITAAVGNFEVDDLHCAKVAITDNLTQRELNWIEISRSLHLLLKFMEDSSKIVKVASNLGLPCDNPSIVEKALLVRAMDPEIQKGLISGRISLPLALELADLDSASASLLANIFQTLVLSLNKQREILSLAKEISLRDELTVLSVLKNTCIENILRQKDLDRGQAGKLFRAELRKKRFPSLTRHEAIFHDYTKSLRLPPKVKMTPPRDFEGRTYGIQLQFKNMDELLECRKTIDRIVNHPDTKSMIE